MAVTLKKVVYVTSSEFKVEENRIFRDNCELDGVPVRNIFEFEIRKAQILETLEVDLRVMVQSEVTNAYSQIKVPCIVEHAGLIFEDYINDSYPGGLTKPMWNTLGVNFLDETHSQNRRALARSVIAYCDGKSVQTFVGETWGTLADTPRGGRQFYWDTIFMPDDPTGRVQNKTYAEIVEDPSLGIEYKIVHLSQSSRAMIEFLRYLQEN